jgi:hypothetical protein
MEDRFSDELVRGYIAGVLSKGTLVSELQRVQELLRMYTKHPNEDKAFQRGLISRTNQLFRALLEIKGRYPTMLDKKL